MTQYASLTSFVSLQLQGNTLYRHSYNSWKSLSFMVSLELSTYKSAFLTNYFCIVISIESLRIIDYALGHNTTNIETFAVSLLHEKVSITDCKPKLSSNKSRLAQNSAFIEIWTSLTTIFWQKWRKFQDNLYDMIFSDYLLISIVEVDSDFNLLSNTCTVLSNVIIRIP